LSDPLEEAELHAWLAAGADQVIETACAHVFLGPLTAFKMKRHKDLGYVDFSTPERRLWALERELAFNRVAAPDIYRAVRRITREADGSLALEGGGPVVDHVLEMRRFDEGAVLAADPDVIDGALADLLGRTIAGFHAEAPLRPGAGWRAMEFTVNSNANLLRELDDKLDAGRVESLIALTGEALAANRDLLEARGQAGFSRRCHGDLHLANILLEAGRPVLFDCIEFSDVLSDLDVQYDLAFLLMDLDFRGRRDAGVRVLSAYLDAAARRFPTSLWDGLAALPLMLSVRAGVRAHVCAHGGDLDTARAYVETAIAHLSPAAPVLAAVGGLSGTGKSSFARAIAPGLGRSPGAVILRTDEVRKRLLGVAPDAQLAADAYGRETTLRTYDALIDEARAVLAAGQAVVLDATFIDPELRHRAEVLAAACGLPFHGVWLETAPEILRGRIADRTGDASDATLATLEDQLARDAGPMSWSRLEASGPTDILARNWIADRTP